MNAVIWTRKIFHAMGIEKIILKRTGICRFQFYFIISSEVRTNESQERYVWQDRNKTLIIAFLLSLETKTGLYHEKIRKEKNWNNKEGAD